MPTLTINYAMAWKMDVDPIATGRRLKLKRREFSLSQEKLSEILEKIGNPASRNAISSWETGKKVPTLSHVVTLSELYGCRLGELVLSYSRSRDEVERDQPSHFNGLLLGKCTKDVSITFFNTQKTRQAGSLSALTGFHSICIS